MYIQDIKNFHYDKSNIKSKYFPNFNGNINKTVHTFQLGAKELSDITRVSDQCRQLNIIFQTASSNLIDLFKKGLTFLVPMGAMSFILKDTLNSEEVSNVKIEKNYDDKSPNELISLTIGGEEDIAKLVVSKDGLVDVIADEDLTEDDLNKYLLEISKNHDKLIESVSAKTENATDYVTRILKDKNFNKIDLSSPEQVQDAIKKFIDDRKRVTALSQRIGRIKFVPQFCAEYNKTTISNLGTMNNGDKVFSFSDLDNQYFNGIYLIVTDNKEKTKQWFIAMNDGNIYKSPMLGSVERIPKHFLDIDNLVALTPAELKDSELNYMFNYACSHLDSICNAMLYEFSKRKVINVDTINQINNEVNKKTRVITEKPFSEETAKTVKVYDLDSKTLENMKEIENLMHRITKAYLGGSNKLDKRANMTERSGLIRKKFINGYIIKDVLLNDKMSIGISKHSYVGKNEALFSLGFFDENNNEVARLKILNEGQAKLLLKPTATREFADGIEKFLNYEFENGLTERLLTRLNEACYYHENYAQVNKYISKSYFPITAMQAVRELMADKNFYKFNDKEISQIKTTSDDIVKIYKKYSGKAYRVQQAFFPEIRHQSNRFLCGRINELNINYEAMFIDKNDLSGIRIVTKNSNGKILNCYVIEDDGTAYKLSHLPKAASQRFVLRKSGFIKLDEDAVKKEHLDLIFINLYNTVTVYNDLIQKCVEHGVTLTDDDVTKKAEEYKTILKEKNAKTSTIYNSSSELLSDTITDSEPLTPELKSRYAKMLTPEGEFKSLAEISIEEVVKQLDRIFDTPYEERSPHLIHDIKDDDGNILLNRFSVVAPGGAWISVTKNKTNEYKPFIYYSIRVQKDDEVMDIKIHQKEYTILRCDENNSIMENDEGKKLSINQAKFVSDNPLSKNMPIYFAEIFAEKPDAERKVIKLQKFKNTRKSNIARQAETEFLKALTAEIPAEIKEELKMDVEPEEETHKTEGESDKTNEEE